MTKTLDRSPRNAPRVPRRSAAKAGARIKRAHKGWSPERRAKQAEIIRSSKPWLKSTGPRTAEGKARTASNALKHGFRSRAYIERIRAERQLVQDATAVIALVKALLRIRIREARALRGPHTAEGPYLHDLYGRRAQPNPPVKPL